MVVMRLARHGRNKYPVYRIVAAESSRAVTGKFIAVLGHYNPHTKEIQLDSDQIKKFLGNGAQPSNTVAKLLQRNGVELPAWVKIKTKAPKKSDEPEVTEEEAAADADQADADAAESEERVAEVATENEAAIEESVPEVAAAEDQPDVDPESAEAVKEA